MSEDKTVRIEPREPDPVRASNILAGIPARTEAMFAAFQAINRRERKAPSWRELQILNFIRYVKMYADDLARSYEAQRIDSVAQAMRNLLEMCIWTEFCEISEANAKRLSDRRRRGASWSSNCFQTSSAFSFSFFIVISRKEFDSPDRVGTCDRQLTVHGQQKRQRLNKDSFSRGTMYRALLRTPAAAGAPLQGFGTIRTRDVAVTF